MEAEISCFSFAAEPMDVDSCCDEDVLKSDSKDPSLGKAQNEELLKQELQDAMQEEKQPFSVGSQNQETDGDGKVRRPREVGQAAAASARRPRSAEESEGRRENEQRRASLEESEGRKEIGRNADNSTAGEV